MSSSPTPAETVAALRDEIEVVLEEAYTLEQDIKALNDPDDATVAHFEGRRSQLEDVHELMIDAERELRSN